MHVWPPLPLVIWIHGYYLRYGNSHAAECVDNIIAILKCKDRLCQIILKDIEDSYVNPLMATIHGPFPGLTYLELIPYE
jgi:hypothetical protein